MIKASDIDEKFDNGEDVSEYFDMENPVTQHPDGEPTKRVNITFPMWLLNEIDSEAKHMAVSRQAIAVMWLAEKAQEKEQGRIARSIER